MEKHDLKTSRWCIPLVLCLEHALDHQILIFEILLRFDSTYRGASPDTNRLNTISGLLQTHIKRDIIQSFYDIVVKYSVYTKKDAYAKIYCNSKTCKNQTSSSIFNLDLAYNYLAKCGLYLGNILFRTTTVLKL